MLYLHSSNSEFDLVVNFIPLILLLAMEWPGSWRCGFGEPQTGAHPVRQLLRTLPWARQNTAPCGAKILYISLYMRDLQRTPVASLAEPQAAFFILLQRVSGGVNCH